MTRQHLLFGVALGVLGGCGSVDGGELYRELAPGDTPELDRGFLDASATPSPGVTGPTASESTVGADTPLEPVLGADAADPDPVLEPSPPAPPVDDVPPSIEWTLPADGDVAVTADAAIVIQFSEAMDTAATEAAYRGNLGDDVTFSWSAGNTRLTLEPVDGLAYASGREPLAALRYSVTFDDARDVAGNALGAASFAFSTLRHVRVELSPVLDPELTGSVRGDGQAPGGECAAALCAGDASAGPGGAPETQHKAFLSFDLDALPVQLIELSDARIEVQGLDTEGDPFAGLGELHVERADFQRIGPAAFAADPDATLGVLESSGEPATSGDIAWVVQEDLATGRYSQYRLCFPQINDNDGATDLVRFEPAEQVLSISYWAP
jgi:Big-like domain-containing protein